MRFVGFIGPSYTLKSVNVDCQRCINLYPEVNEIGTGKEKEIAALVSTPGLTLQQTLPVSPHRGIFTAANGRVFAASYNKLYEIFNDGTNTELATLTTYAGPVSFADSGIRLAVVDGSKFGFFYTFATSLVTACGLSNL